MCKSVYMYTYSVFYNESYYEHNVECTAKPWYDVWLGFFDSLESHGGASVRFVSVIVLF